ncbi:unnamed protein product [Adineta steineri]|uniref:TRPM-like domain-containing protein n=1 Tax=Adineta steineri TaxID=433720 RepID=A0A816BEB6_9BILA|nr:unnamed protein product [Adineta steineri]CAF1608895.1 unnamed protein product [Adineta steineri]
MAKIILGQMKTRICSALVASKILKSLTRYAPDHDSKDQLCSEADIFESYAIEFVRCSYSYNKQKACELIMRRVDVYKGVTCLQMAMAADTKKFLYEDACQALLTNIWFDKGPALKRPERRLEKYGIDYSDDYGKDESIFRHFIHFHNTPVVKYSYTCTTDLLLFIFIIVVVIFGYGVTSRSMTAYRTFDFDGRQFFHNVVYPVYYFVLGSFDNELSQLDATPDASTSIATHIMFAFHMLFVNILLLNLLIALFSNTINDVQTHANHVWAYDRCALIRDYYNRPALFPPLTFLVSIYQFCDWWWPRCRTQEQKLSCFKMIPKDPDLDNEWSVFERFSTNDYIRQLLDAQASAAANTMDKENASDQLTTTTDSSKWLRSDMNQLRDEFTTSRIDTTIQLSSMDSTVSFLDNRVEQIDNSVKNLTIQMVKFQDSLNWIMTAMARVKMDKDPPLFQQALRKLIMHLWPKRN